MADCHPERSPLVTADISPPVPPANTPVMLVPGQDTAAPPGLVPAPAHTPLRTKDFAVSAFSKPEDMEKLVRALAQHDARQSLLEAAQFAFFPVLSPRLITLRPIPYSFIESVQLAESLRTYNPIPSPGDEATESGSSTERDEPGSGSSSEREEAGLISTHSASFANTLFGGLQGMQEEQGGGPDLPAKKGKKKKNKKKKGKGKAKGAEGDAAEDDTEGKGATDEAGPTDQFDEGKELEEIEVELGMPLVPDVKDTSGDTLSNGLSIIVTPETPPIAPTKPQAASFSPIAAQKLTFGTFDEEDGTDLDAIDTGCNEEVMVKLPGHGRNAGASEREAKPSTGPTSESTNVTTQVKLPLTPPMSPKLPPRPPVTVNEPIHLGFDELFTSPQPVLEHTPQSRPSDYPDAMPLSHSWALYHSNTGGGATTAAHSARLAATSVPGLPSAPVFTSHTRSKAEEYSHGLFLLFAASNVVDLLGTWKALRRKIALKKGRPIEPEGQPIQPGTEGLGIFYLPEDTNFHFFVSSIKPMWEDPMCGKGGKVMLTGNPGQMDSIFLQAVLLLAGGSFDGACPTVPGINNLIVGASLSRRKAHTRIEIWLGGRDAPATDWIRSVEGFLKKCFPSEKLFLYKSFKDPRKAASGDKPTHGGKRTD